MRMCDWSSDVCSSDLLFRPRSSSSSCAARRSAANKRQGGRGEISLSGRFYGSAKSPLTDGPDQRAPMAVAISANTSDCVADARANGAFGVPVGEKMRTEHRQADVGLAQARPNRNKRTEGAQMCVSLTRRGKMGRRVCREKGVG